MFGLASDAQTGVLLRALGPVRGLGQYLPEMEPRFALTFVQSGTSKDMQAKRSRHARVLASSAWDVVTSLAACHPAARRPGPWRSCKIRAGKDT